MKKRKLSRADKLEIERTLLSNERTLLAYLSTGFAAMVLGIAFLKLFEPGLETKLGESAIIIGVLFILIGFASYFYRKKVIVTE